MCHSALLEGDDHYRNLKAVFQHINNDLIVPGFIVMKGIKYPCLVWLGGDMVFVSNCLGLGGRFACDGFNCIWCEVHSNDLYKTTPSEPRTLRRIYNLGHMPVPAHLTQDGPQFPFACPGCAKTFTCMEDVYADFDLGPKTDKHKAAYLKTHFGVSHMQPPLVDIPLWLVILCMLHLVLSVVKTIWSKQVVGCITTHVQADRCNAMLKFWGCHVR